MSKRIANFSFTEFYDEIEAFIEIAKKCPIRKAIAKQYSIIEEPRSGFDTATQELIKGTNIRVRWRTGLKGFTQDLDDLGKGKGGKNRAIARYYYLHSLSELKFARAVDAVLFKDEKPEKRTFEGKFGRPVFLPYVDIEPEFDHENWRSPLNQWEITNDNGKPLNGKLANFSMESQLSNRTDQPISMHIEVYVNSAYVEYKKGSFCEIKFKSATIETKLLGESIRSQIELQYTDNWPQKSGDAAFELVSTQSYLYIELGCENGLSGKYVSSRVFDLTVKQPSCGFEARLSVSIKDTDVCFPEELGANSKLKQKLIDRMVHVEKMPPPDISGHITLHTLVYNFKAVDGKSR